MRAQLSRLHERLGVTTVYVTHDQVEAMTLGQRVAVMRGGVLQQCDTPEQLFDHPANLFVAAFIGSPAMNLVEATVEDGEARFGTCRDPTARGRRCAAGSCSASARTTCKLGGPGIPGRRTGGRAARHRDPRRRRHRRPAPARRRAGRRHRRRRRTTTSCSPRTTAPSFTVVTDARAAVAVGDRIELTVDPDRLALL